MLISYENFLDKLHHKIKSGEDFYISLLETVIDNPSRYCGLFRLSNAKTKLIQNVTQSMEIKFGDFMEEIVTDYIALLGYTNITKDLGFDANGDRLNADQVFIKNNTVYLVEQKIRDDHDSTKKRGQYANFEKKVLLLKAQHPTKIINASMWFIDDALVKNKNYYQMEMNNSLINDCQLNLFYGREFFLSLDGGSVAWTEIITYLRQNRISNTNDIFTIPDFGTSVEIYNALLKLKTKHWRKLLSNDEKYVLLRSELFGSGDNLERARAYLNL